MRPLLHVMTVIACLFVSTGVRAAGDIEAGELRAQTCMGCHGAPGMRNAYPAYRVPKLGGQHDFYIISTLESYQAGERAHPTMQAQAAGLSARDMEDIAAYFQSLGEPAFNEVAENNPAQQCAACHNPDGNSPADPTATQGAPILAGQYPDYIVRSLLDYQSGERQNALMKGMAAALNRSQMEAIADFYAAQDGLAAPRISN